MDFEFVKYQGTGNDFVMIDGRGKDLRFSAADIRNICDRRFGIGADGLIIILDHDHLDFEMDYYNADGSKSFCGNGSRCAQAFAKELGIIEKGSRFLAIDGVHDGVIDGDVIATKMGDVSANAIERIRNDWYINTGSPHYIRFVDELDSLEVVKEGRSIRYSDTYKKEGTNVNFVELNGKGIKVRTYERGVEDETLSCGTGVTACAIAYVLQEQKEVEEVSIQSRGGELKVRLEDSGNDSFKNIWLVGPAKRVFQGAYSS